MQAFECAMFALNISSPINYVIRLKGKYRQHVRGTKRVKLNTNIINGGLWLHYHKQRGIGNWKKAISTFDGLLARHYHYHLVCCVRQFSNKNQFWNNSLPGKIAEEIMSIDLFAFFIRCWGKDSQVDLHGEVSRWPAGQLDQEGGPPSGPQLRGHHLYLRLQAFL